METNFQRSERTQRLRRGGGVRLRRREKQIPLFHPERQYLPMPDYLLRQRVGHSPGNGLWIDERDRQALLKSESLVQSILSDPASADQVFSQTDAVRALDQRGGEVGCGQEALTD